VGVKGLKRSPLAWPGFSKRSTLKLKREEGRKLLAGTRGQHRPLDSESLRSPVSPHRLSCGAWIVMKSEPTGHVADKSKSGWPQVPIRPTNRGAADLLYRAAGGRKRAK
jgi:hypothetical protein